MRQLSLIFGVTAYAASTVLAAFMAGLALGSWLAGPLLARIKRPLFAFGVAEIVIGASAIATPVALSLSSSLYAALYAAAPDSFVLQTGARLMSAFVVLLVPTMLMGLTLPLLSASPLVKSAQASSGIGALYAVNTAGAVSGALLTGFVLIGAIGQHRTFLAAATLNALVGLAAMALDRFQARRAVATQDDAIAADKITGTSLPRPASPPRVAWAVMAISGFGSLALEVVWFRIMTQYVDATTYAFTSMLAVVLLGIAIGGAVASPLLARDRDWHAWLALNQLAIGVLALAGVLFFARDRVFLLGTLAPWQGLVLAVFLPAFLMGISFPLLLRLGGASVASGESVAERELRGRMVGRYYGVNVLGAIAGSLAGGFVILPSLGTRLSLVALGGLFLLSGLALCLTHPKRLRMAALGGAFLVLFAIAVARTPDPLARAMRAHTGIATAQTLFHEEGVQTTVSVYATRTQRTMFVNGLHQANDSADMVKLHRTIGLLPMALHPSPVSGLVIGLGGGATAGGAARHPGVSLQVVELSDSVRKAAAYFSEVNYDVLNLPNVRMRVDDGRNFLLFSREKFDVITADVIQPVHAGAGGLYSREYFELVRQSLRPGGLVLQWISKQQRSHYVLIMRTFLEVFPNATLWLDGNLMVGSVEPFKLSERVYRAKVELPQMREALEAIGLDSWEMLRSWYTAGPKEMAAFVGPGVVLTDDLPLVEYHRSLTRDDGVLDTKQLRGSVRDVETP